MERTILVTGCGGFIGYHVAAACLARGYAVFGIDSMNDYYTVELKERRQRSLEAHRDYRWVRCSITERSVWEEALLDAGLPPVAAVIHLAAQAGVRYSLDHPMAYIESNILGQMAVLEYLREHPTIPLIYASSSSVYGRDAHYPSTETDRTDSPASLYAATKKSAEILTDAYAHLYGLSATALRYFTVYGPWGRPDMAPFIFSRALLRGEPLTLFNHGKMRRNFTYIDDAVGGTLGALDHPGREGEQRCYNIGNDGSVELESFVDSLAACWDLPARKRYEALQPGDVVDTVADIAAARRDLGFAPRTSLDEGLASTVAWYRSALPWLGA
jgi:UDP-glucuronate 4-epimerase